MSSRDILAAHPSVQDLGIQYGGINLAKTGLHRMLINSKPLHEMGESDIDAMYHKHKKGGRSTEPKGAKVTVVKNATNGVAGPTPILPNIAAPSSPSAALFGASARPPSSSSSRPNLNFNSNNNNSAAAALTPPRTGGFTVTNTRTNGKTQQTPRIVTRLPPRPNPSLVSSAFSYSDAEGCSECGSFSMYSCSCCHVKPPSSCGSTPTTIPSSSVASTEQRAKMRGRKYKVGTTYCVRSNSAQRLSAAALDESGSNLGLQRKSSEGEEDLAQYENLTSVSQRISNVSVTSTQIAALQQELESERRSRLQTQIELQRVRERQQQLLDRLASKEHDNMTLDDKNAIKRMLKEVTQQLTAMSKLHAGGTSAVGGGKKASGSGVGAPLDASDSVLK